MSNKSANNRVALIGLGPRGLGALEALAMEAQRADIALNVDIFDPFKWPGAGPNFDPDQSDLCILNIPIRALDIDPPAFLGDCIGSFSQWSPVDYKPDDFPPRSDFGAYLNARYKALVARSKDVLKITTFSDRVLTIKHTDKLTDTGWSVCTEKTTHGPYGEIAMSPGQPKTKPDPQLEKWGVHADALNWFV